jgi:hypothetical protein
MSNTHSEVHGLIFSLWSWIPHMVLCKKLPRSKEEATLLKMQSPVLNPLVENEAMVEKDVMLVNNIKDDELTKCASHFEYMSTMSSFDDHMFKSTIRKDLLRDRHASWKAFNSLSLKLV